MTAVASPRDRGAASRAAAAATDVVLDMLDARGAGSSAARAVVARARAGSVDRRRERRLLAALDDDDRAANQHRLRTSSAAAAARWLGYCVLRVAAPGDDLRLDWVGLAGGLGEALQRLGVPRPRGTANEMLADALAREARR